MDLDKTRETLMFAALPHVAFDGWTRKAIEAGAADAGLDRAAALNAYPGGAAELIEVFSHWADARMLAELEKRDLAALRVRDRVAMAVRLRLEIVEAHREAVRRSLSFLALPGNAALGLRLLYRTVDAIWYAAGDTSTDYNFYSKRLLLAGVYSSTLLVWLNDTSEDHAQAWAFLDRRISEVLKIGGRLGKSMKSLLDLPDRVMRFRPRARAR
ncbi:MAG: COQ9 family protein [Kiloniellales bacterium]|nr:COQ9 family protein [Kiloniellales bacterium]